ncbi:MAG: sulfite exporter TauE/SafE family protein [Clostridia bacterium]|nr:sulfite exporter TauE/SafE family protein [Clostridia bacterium]
MKHLLFFSSAFLSGMTNGLFGAGGGILAVKSLSLKGLEQKKAQATALTATFMMSVISCGVYLYKGYFNPLSAVYYLPFGIIGAIAGACLLKKIPDKILRKVFSIFIIWSGMRMIFR